MPSFLKSFDWQHGALTAAAIVLAVISLRDASSGHPLTEYGVPVAAALTTILAMFKGSPAQGGSSGSGS